MSLSALKESEISEQRHLHLHIHFRTYLENLTSELQQLYREFATCTGEFRLPNAFGQSTWQQQFANLSLHTEPKTLSEEDILVVKGSFQEFELLVREGGRTPDQASRYLQKRAMLEKNMEWVQEVLKCLEAQKHLIEIWKKDKEIGLKSDESEIRDRISHLYQMLEDKAVNKGKESQGGKRYSRMGSSQQRSELESRVKEEYGYFMERIGNLIMKNMTSIPTEQFNKLKEMATGPFGLASPTLRSIKF